MELRQLQYAVAVIDHGGFTRAAAAMYVSQPSLSQGVANLESELGTPLFHRVGRRVVLTAAGQAFAEPAGFDGRFAVCKRREPICEGKLGDAIAEVTQQRISENL